jgi:hypothetical protein
MTILELVEAGYAWLCGHSTPLFLGSAALPAGGALLARIGKAGKTDADGRFIASAGITLAFVFSLAMLGILLAAHELLGVSFSQVDIRLLLAPLVCLGATLLGMRLVFPLSELGSVRTARDILYFVLVSVGLLWVLSTFRGWGVMFVGSLTQLVVLGVATLLFLRYLFQRAFRG